jgi:hypothetical protein
MRTDETNKRNIIMFFSYIGMIFICIAAIIVVIAIAGTANINQNIGSLDRPRASISFHDHRL